MKVNSLNIRNKVQIKHTPIYNPHLAHVEEYKDFIIQSVVSSGEGHRITMIQFDHLEVVVVIEEIHLGDEESSISVRYTKHNTPTVEIYKEDCFLYDFDSETYFPKEEVIAAINNQLKKDYNFIVFPFIDYNSICNF